jgi:hypothetical protein
MSPSPVSFALVLIGIALLGAETATRFVGTVTSIAPQNGTAQVKTALGESILIHLNSGTIFQRVGPGEKNLNNAKVISAADIAPGDRVLVNLDPGTADARRLVVMPAAEISKRDEADRELWTTRGVGGIVTSTNGRTLTLNQRSGLTTSQVQVTVGANATFRKYAPDSVKFADAKPASLEDVRIGDQLRARGEKSPDGLTVAASDIVFGSFVTKAGKIMAVDLDAHALTIAELNTGKTLRILVVPGSQIKAMPDFAAMGGPPGAPNPATPNPGTPDLARMIEFMPSAELSAFKPGQSVLLSSTRGAKEDEFTAILLLGNAEMLIRMASMGGSPSAGSAKASGGVSPGGMNGGGFDLSAMTP